MQRIIPLLFLFLCLSLVRASAAPDHEVALKFRHPLFAETFHWLDGAFLSHSFTAANNRFEGEVPLTGVISGGPGAAGLGIEVEFSGDLRNWDRLPLRIADENGSLSFRHFVRADKTPELFYRGRVP